MNKPILHVIPSGELITQDPRKVLRGRNKPDSPFFSSIVPWVVLLLFATIDGSIFLSRFQLMVYDNAFLRVLAACAMLTGFDLVPIYTAIFAKRLYLGLEKEKSKFFLYILLSVTALAVVLNVYINVATMDMMAPAKETSGSTMSQQVSGGMVSQEPDGMVPQDPAAVSGEEQDESVAVALTVFGSVAPVVTSLASFCISFFIYDPIEARKKQMEAAIAAEEAELVRLKAYLDEYRIGYSSFKERAEAEEERRYCSILEEERALVVRYCHMVRITLMQLLPDTLSRSALAAHNCETLLSHLDAGMALMNSEYAAAIEAASTSASVPVPSAPVTVTVPAAAAPAPTDD